MDYAESQIQLGWAPVKDSKELAYGYRKRHSIIYAIDYTKRQH